MLLAVTCVGASCVLARPVSAGETRVRVATERLDLAFGLDGASPVEWRACHPTCARADDGSGTSVRLTAEPHPPQARVVIRGPGAPVDLQRLRFTAGLTEEAEARVVKLEADLPVDGVRVVKSFEIAKHGYLVVMTVQLLGPQASTFMAGCRLEVEVAASPTMFPPPAAGFAETLDRVGRVVVTARAVRALPDHTGEQSALRAGDWAGVRSRFWTIVVRSTEPATLTPRPGGGLALLMDDPARMSWRYTFYAGPIERQALSEADPTLESMVLSDLWFWLRGLSLALLALLRGLTGLVGHPGVAIIALAVSVKILLFPLTRLADCLQEQVDATQVRLQPAIEAIRAAYRGEERARRTLALYREQGVHPLYTMKSLLGLLIQIPVFIAVFDMLAEDFDLYHVSFLWMRDLSRPDELLRLPACVPFFGCFLNLLPFLMSGASLVALLRVRSHVLTPALVRKQRRNLSGLTLLFFLLFYTFPASMVLYWTSTNFFQLARQELSRLWSYWHTPRTAPPS